MDQRQGLRDVRAARPLARHQGRDREPAEARHVAHRQRREPAEGLNQDHDLRRRPPRLVLLPVLRDGAGRRDRHRHAARRRARHEADPAVPQGRRRGAPRHCRARRAAAEGGAVQDMTLVLRVPAAGAYSGTGESSAWFWCAATGLGLAAAVAFRLLPDLPPGIPFDERLKAELVLNGSQNFRHPILMLQLVRLANLWVGAADLPNVIDLGRAVAAAFGGLTVFAAMALA